MTGFLKSNNPVSLTSYINALQEQLLPFLTASFLLTIAPGPDIIYVLVQSVAHGKKKGFFTALGLVSGILVHTTLVAFGVSALISNAENLFFFIKLLGACYMLYLAYQVYKSPAEVVFSATKVPNKKNWALYKQGFLMNVLNPKVILFFLAFFPGFLWAPEGNTVYQFYNLGLLFMAQALLVFSTIALLGGQVSGYLKNHQKSGRVLKWTQIIVFVGLSILILWP